MGKGRIVSNNGAGSYIVEIIEDRTRAESSRATSVRRVAELDRNITSAENEIPALQQAVDAAALEQDQAIALHQQQLASSGETTVDLAASAVAVIEAAARRDSKRMHIGQMKAERLSHQARIEQVDALPPLRQISAWCADYTEDLSGEVATAEVPGEVGQVIIKPGFEGANQWSEAADGAIQPALAGTSAGVFYNLAMMPGWQKWRPTFRIATISNISNDTCNIDLVPAASSQQGLDVNVQSTYSDVPIMYMDCNGAAFEEGDRVLVGFSGDANSPIVVGFEKEPKVCCAPEVLAIYSNEGALWQVQSLFGDLAIPGGAASEWRITNESGSEIVYSGGVIKAPDGSYRLDGLPDEADVLRREVVTELFYSEDGSKQEGESMGSLSPPTRPAFAGGQWYVSSDRIDTAGNVIRGPAWDGWGQGSIDANGSPVISDPLPVLDVGYDGESSWDGVAQKGKSITYTKSRGSLVLEKGCNGEWPEDAE